jgi:hypothetical protein
VWLDDVGRADRHAAKQHARLVWWS